MVPKVPKTLLVVDGLSTTKNIKMKNAMVQKTRIENKNVTLIPDSLLSMEMLKYTESGNNN